MSAVSCQDISGQFQVYVCQIQRRIRTNGRRLVKQKENTPAHMLLCQKKCKRTMSHIMSEEHARYMPEKMEILCHMFCRKDGPGIMPEDMPNIRDMMILYISKDFF